MRNLYYKQSYIFLKYLIAMFVAMMVLVPHVAEARLVCEERERSCVDAGSKPMSVPGGTYSMPAPVIEGYDRACWHWRKRFECVETNPTLRCDSGENFDDVKNKCSLVDANIIDVVKINAVTYITEAEYFYRCAWTEWITKGALPDDQECVLLVSEAQDTEINSTIAKGQHPTTGNPPRVPPMDHSVVVEQDRVKGYVCYSPPQTVCSDTCFEDITDPASGTIRKIEVACESPVTNCVESNDQCNASISGKGASSLDSASISLGPDGRCVSSTKTSMCENQRIPRCLDNDNCTLDSTKRVDIQSNGVSMTQEQNYICTNTTKSCTEISEVNNCVSVSAWGWDNLQHQTTSGLGLGEYNQALAKLDAINKGLNDDDLYIFSGQNLKCRYAVGNFLNTAIMIGLAVGAMVISGGASTGMTASLIKGAATSAVNAGAITLSQFATIYSSANAIGAAVSIGGAAIQDAPNSKALGSDCCKSHVIEGSDAWYKFGKCTADEVKLSVARQKGLYHYLGTYCSKRSGFPIRQCVQKTKSYCVFDDMLALVVNKQGRQQLDEIASADPVTVSSTSDMSFDLYAPRVSGARKYSGVLNNGSWKHLTTRAGSPVWYWQYPGYCRTKEEQERAYSLQVKEANDAIDIKGLQPTAPDDYEKVLPNSVVDFDMSHYEPHDAVRVLANIAAIEPFQDCADSEGLVHFMTCSTGSNCDTSKLPDSPEGSILDIHGEMFEIYKEHMDPKDFQDYKEEVRSQEADVRWRSQQVHADLKPGDYGVTATMASNSSYAAVSSSLSAYVTGVGSCRGEKCLFKFIFTDRNANRGLGARKRVSEYAEFPLYALQDSATYPTINYLTADGQFNSSAHNSDPNVGVGSTVELNQQRFIFRPNHQSTEVKGKLHSHVLLEWATSNTGEIFKPILVPTDLPPATSGFYPHGNASDGYGHFYLTGGCDLNSRWCAYEIEANLNIQRHPWGSAKNPRCWGFTVEQVAALDFDSMDLSQWLKTLDLSAISAGLDASAEIAFTEQVMSTAQATYSNFKEGDTVQSHIPGSKALVISSDTLPHLSGDPFSAYTVQAAVPTNWPTFYEDEPNHNPIFNPMIDWGDGSEPQQMIIHEDGRIYHRGYDYGELPVKDYKITVTFDTEHNGPQTLTTTVHITPHAGNAPETGKDMDFSSPNSVGKYPQEYTPARASDGTMIDEVNLDQLSPGKQTQFGKQGDSISR